MKKFLMNKTNVITITFVIGLLISLPIFILKILALFKFVGGG